MSESGPPRPHPGAFVVVTLALLVFFAAVSRLGKPDDPSGIQRIVNTLRADVPDDTRSAPDRLAGEPEDDFTRERRRIIAERGNTSQQFGSRNLESGLRHPVTVTRIAVPPETAPAPVVSPRRSGSPSRPSAVGPGESSAVASSAGSAADPRARRSPSAAALSPAGPADVAARPGAAGVERPAPAVGTPIQHTVKDGESLATIAKHYYRGDMRQLPRLLQANPWLGDVPRLETGKILVIPPANPQ